MNQEGIPFTIELFTQEPDAAKQFLSIYQEKSFGLLGSDWATWTEGEIIEEAITRLEEVHADLGTTDFLRRHGGLH